MRLTQMQKDNRKALASYANAKIYKRLSGVQQG